MKYKVTIERMKKGKTLYWMLLVAIVFMLSACSGEKTEQVESDETSSAEQQETSTSETEPTEQEEKLATPSACEGIVLESNASIEGKRLGDCIMAAMLAVETGTHRVQSSDGSNSVVDFQWKPEFSMHVKSEDTSIVLKENTGWIKLDGGKWIEESDPSEDTETIIAVNTLKLARVFSSPAMIAQYLALGNTWIVVEETSVPAADAFVDIAWKLVPEGPIVLEGITMTNTELYLTNDYLGAYYVSTGNVAGISTTTSNTYMQWGDPIIIPEPGA